MPPERGTTLITGPPDSASPRPPDVVTAVEAPSAAAAGLPYHRVRIVQTVTGGGFGGKLFVRVDAVLAALKAEETIATLERKAELVQRRLGLLGRVNLLAGGELESLQERHDFLARELDDVKKARRDLLEVIRRIEDEIVETFAAAYRDVAAEFERLFTSLFPGGEGRLIATEPTDLLNTGIEIEARPPGKRMKRLSLLSGGERALTALALLFAVFLTNPAPICVLDEVDAPLDDANVDRFCDLLQEFAEKGETRFLLITHHRLTMARMDRLYGVTMEEPGVSKLISIQLN